MENLYDQLQRLQRMPNAYTEWAAYRKGLTDYIVEHTAAGDTAVILGAGPCNDFDLGRLTRHFAHVSLLDINTDSIREGLNRQAIPESVVSIYHGDLSGVPADVYRELAESVMAELRSGDPDPKAVSFMFYDAIESAMTSLRPDPIQGGPYDHIICCGVHSQLLNPFAQMAAVYARYVRLDLKGIFARISGANGILTCALNTLLLSAPKKSAILGLETGRNGMEGGIEGASQALSNLDDLGVTPDSEETLTWPFDASQGKVYSVRVAQYLKPTKK